MKRLKRQWFIALISAIVIALPGQAVFAEAASAAVQQAAKQEGMPVFVDDKKLSFSPSPVTKNGTTLVPMRPIFTALDAEVTWEPKTKTIFVRRDYTTITLQVGSSQAVINGTTVKLAVSAQTIEGATMVPLRFVSEALGGKAEWDSKTKSIRIYSEFYLYEMEEAAEQAASEAAEKTRKKLTATEIVEANDDKIVMITTDTGQGSGIIVGDRWILTNYHVVGGANEGSVMFNDGTSLDIIGVAAADEMADLAVIQTSEDIGELPVRIGDSRNVKKGERVYAIGSPLGLQNTVSEGLVSNQLSEGGTRYFQINAPIDHGSSGGGLFNEYGELIGITASGIDNSIADLNFAIAAVHAEWLMMDLESDPPAASEIEFPPSTLPDSLADASMDDIRELVEEEYGEVQTSEGVASFKDWSVSRDAEGWLVISAVIDPAYYMLYGHQTADELKFWTVNLGTELRRMLPDDKIQFLIYYSQTFSSQPRGFESSEVTSLGDGKWRVQYAVINLQIMDRMHLQMRI
jgi:serine protease Do